MAMTAGNFGESFSLQLIGMQNPQHMCGLGSGDRVTQLWRYRVQAHSQEEDTVE